MPYTFLRPYLNSEPISLVVRLKGPSSRGHYLYRSWLVAKTRWWFPSVMSTVVNPLGIINLIHVSYVLTLIKAYSILVWTLTTWFVCPFYLGWWWVGRRKAPFGPKSFVAHPTNSQCVPLPMMGFEYVNGLLPIHKGTLGPLVGIIPHLVVSDLLIYPFSLKEPYLHLERS